MKVAIIACGNGLGHVKRLVKIGNAIQNRAPYVKLTVFCESWQLTKLKGWSDFHRLLKQGNGEFTSVSVPVKWNSDQNYFGDWLWKWHTIISTWQLDSFDHVISDNLIEPLLYNDQTTLSGSFLWHNILSTAFPHNQEIHHYKEWAENIMLSAQPDMIVNRYFAMPAIEEQANVFKVGVINFNRVVENELTKRLPKNILVALGNAKNVNRNLEQVVNAIPIFDKIGVAILCPPRWYRTLSKYSSNVTTYNFDNHDLGMADIAIVLGGLGTISDCIAARIPMLYVRSNNPELTFNQEQLSNFGIGMPLQDVLQNRRSPLIDVHLYIEMINRCKYFTLHGEVEAADFLLTLWRAN